MSKVPETCAVCPWSAKVSEQFTPAKHRGWYCACGDRGNDLVGDRIPCRRGALPVPPKWCQRRKM